MSVSKNRSSHLNPSISGARRKANTPGKRETGLLCRARASNMTCLLKADRRRSRKRNLPPTSRLMGNQSNNKWCANVHLYGTAHGGIGHSYTLAVAKLWPGCCIPRGAQKRGIGFDKDTSLCCICPCLLDCHCVRNKLPRTCVPTENRFSSVKTQ